MIFTLEFLHHFNICNRAEFGDKKQFYALKTQILRRFGRLLRYELQTFEKDWCYECQCSVSMRQCSDRHCGGEPISLHQHILEVYEAKAEDGSLHHYHVPTGEFKYTNYAQDRYSKKSAGFDALYQNTVRRTGLKELDKTIPSESARKSLEWLQEWAQEHLYRPTLSFGLRPYHIPPTGKRRHYNRVRSDGRVVFDLDLDLKTERCIFARRWQTAKGMNSGPAQVWPAHVRRPLSGMYSIEEKDWNVLVKIAKPEHGKENNTAYRKGQSEQETL